MTHHRPALSAACLVWSTLWLSGGAMSERPNSTYRQFVQRRASEKGLDIIGWN